MDPQLIINILFLSVSLLAGWVMKFIHGRLNKLEERDDRLESRLHRIDVLVAGKYVTKDDMSQALTQLFHKLDSIEQKLDQKADK